MQIWKSEVMKTVFLSIPRYAFTSASVLVMSACSTYTILETSTDRVWDIDTSLCPKGECCVCRKWLKDVVAGNPQAVRHC